VVLRLKKTDKPPYDLVPQAGLFVGELVDISEVDGKWGPCLRFLFKLQVPGVENAIASLLQSTPFIEGSKTDQFIKALGVSLKTDDEIDPSVLKGRKIQLVIEPVIKGDKKFNAVKSYIPMPSAPAAPVAPQPVAHVAQPVITPPAPQTQQYPAPAPVTVPPAARVPSTPVQPAPVQPAPVQPAPVQPAPVQPAPVQPAAKSTVTPSQPVATQVNKDDIPF